MRRPSSPAGTAVVRGRVLASDTGRPLRARAITLSGPELGREGRSTSTSLDGRYEIADLPAGRYTIRVTPKRLPAAAVRPAPPARARETAPADSTSR